MITIKTNMKKYEVKISGHADFDEKGKDIVCAGISALFYTLYEVLYQNQVMLEPKSLKAIMNEGAGTISCKPKKEYEGNAQLMYMTVLTGFKMMADNYPEYVKFVVVRNSKK